MPTLPWTVARPAEPGSEALVMGSTLELRSYTTIPSFMAAATKLRTAVRRAPGAYGVSLIAQPKHKKFWTLSAWVDQHALDAFVRSPEHADVMRRFHDRMSASSFRFWTVPVESLPEGGNAAGLWAEARARLAVAEP
jgi:heme-degrading monooxygenase HmoA